MQLSEPKQSRRSAAGTTHRIVANPDREGGAIRLFVDELEQDAEVDREGNNNEGDRRVEQVCDPRIAPQRLSKEDIQREINCRERA